MFPLHEQLKKFTKVPRGKDSLQLRHVRQVFSASSMAATVSAKKIVLERDGKSFTAYAVFSRKVCDFFLELRIKKTSCLELSMAK